MRICFVSHLALGAFVPEVDGHYGGVERQTALMGKWFADRGYSISVLTWGHRDPIKGPGRVRLIQMCEETDGVPVLRFFYPRWTSLVAALKAANADIYYHNCAEYVTGQVALWARLNRKLFVYSVASDPECEYSPSIFNNKRDLLFFRYGRRLANSIIVQTAYQRKILFEQTGLESVHLPMPGAPELSFASVQGSQDLQRSDHSGTRALRVIWIGRISEEKQPHLLLQIAKCLPFVEFIVAGDARRDPSYSAPIVQGMQQRPNISYRGRLPFEKIFDLYSTADILLNTSSYEGFPNTFLEAWAHGLGIISMFSCGNLFDDKQIGVYCEDVVDVIEELKIMHEDRSLLTAMENRGKEYFLKNHLYENAMAKFEAHFDRLVSGK